MSIKDSFMQKWGIWSTSTAKWLWQNSTFSVLKFTVLEFLLQAQFQGVLWQCSCLRTWKSGEGAEMLCQPSSSATGTSFQRRQWRTELCVINKRYNIIMSSHGLSFLSYKCRSQKIDWAWKDLWPRGNVLAVLCVEKNTKSGKVLRHLNDPFLEYFYFTFLFGSSELHFLE